MAKPPKPAPKPAPVAEPAPTQPTQAAEPSTSAPARKKKGTSEVSTYVSRMRAASGQGLEHATSKDFATPRLSVLNALSQVISKKLIPEAEVGDLLAGDLNELWGPEGTTIVPVYYKRAWVEQTPRNAGAKFVREHAFDSGVDQGAQKRDGKFFLSNGNELRDVATYFALVLTGQGWKPYVLSMGGTSLKVSRALLTAVASQKMRDGADTFTPPMRAYKYRLGSAMESNVQGTYARWDLKDTGVALGEDEMAVYDQASRFYELVAEGKVKVEPEGEVATEPSKAEKSVPGSQPGFEDAESGDAKDPFEE